MGGWLEAGGGDVLQRPLPGDDTTHQQEAEAAEAMSCLLLSGAAAEGVAVSVWVVSRETRTLSCTMHADLP